MFAILICAFDDESVCRISPGRRRDVPGKPVTSHDGRPAWRVSVNSTMNSTATARIPANAAPGSHRWRVALGLRYRPLHTESGAFDIDNADARRAPNRISS